MPNSAETPVRPAGVAGSAKSGDPARPSGARISNRIPLPGVRAYALTPGYDLDDPFGAACPAHDFQARTSPVKDLTS